MAGHRVHPRRNTTHMGRKIKTDHVIILGDRERNSCACRVHKIARTGEHFKDRLGFVREQDAVWVLAHTFASVLRDEVAALIEDDEARDALDLKFRAKLCGLA